MKAPYVLIITLIFFCIFSSKAFSKKDVKDPFEPFMKQLCLDLEISSIGEGDKPPHVVFEDSLMNFMGINKGTPNYRNLITAFWNTNIDKFVCDSGGDAEKHVLKHIVRVGIFKDVLFKFLLREPNVIVNHLEKINGESETFLDYLNKTLGDPNVDLLYDVRELKRLKKLLIKRYNAKTAKELGY